MSDSFATPWTVARQVPLSMGFPRQEYWSGLLFLLQGIFLTQGSNPSLFHWQANSLPLSHQGSPFPIFRKTFNHTSITSNFSPLLNTSLLSLPYHQPPGGYSSSMEPASPDAQLSILSMRDVPALELHSHCHLAVFLIPNTVLDPLRASAYPTPTPPLLFCSFICDHITSSLRCFLTSGRGTHSGYHQGHWSCLSSWSRFGHP